MRVMLISHFPPDVSLRVMLGGYRRFLVLFIKGINIVRSFFSYEINFYSLDIVHYYICSKNTLCGQILHA